ncbi:isochorismatase family protein [Curtobacterium sp. VKM Ac-1393]|uniref:isochorismatase family protein n=1 Tax=Curtobacterium sp. VKM Ac-1393 TaxID=2783814 RepID=UPI00188C040C|nr:isochorismatase family protein [Curtobacterium sp. VKM Ac-1393]MBF4608731.1 isochorismatase family protein [Curtobacterium sp. VKM Ac-1393]
MARALLIVDVQNDFTEGGALGVTGGAALAKRITAFLGRHAGEYDLIVGSRDWHHGDDDNGGHFAGPEGPDFVDTWPVHCVAGTPGAEYHPELDTDPIDVDVFKGQGKPDYSAFQAHTEGGVPLPEILTEHRVHSVDIVGIATDHCVRASALDARAAGIDVAVYEDLVAGVDDERSARALEDIRSAGGHVDRSDMDEGLANPGGAQL